MPKLYWIWLLPADVRFLFPIKDLIKDWQRRAKNEVKEAKDHIQNVPSLIFQMESFLPKKNGYWMIMQMKGCFN